jgi:hypothetical protein
VHVLKNTMIMFLPYHPNDIPQKYPPSLIDNGVFVVDFLQFSRVFQMLSLSLLDCLNIEAPLSHNLLTSSHMLKMCFSFSSYFPDI